MRLDAIGAFFIAGTSGYMLSSFFSGKVIARLGVGGALAASCALTGSALLGYTLAPFWWVMVCLGVAVGLGAGAIDAGLNTYVAAHFGESLMQWLHASYGLGVTLGPIIWLNLLMFFLYTGAEVSFGSWTYSLLTLSRHVPIEVAGLWAGSYWATFTLGRILAGLLNRRLGTKNLLMAGFLSALGGSILLWWNPFPQASILAVSVIGFALAPIFPGLVSGTSARVGKQHAANTIGMQIGAAGFGGAVVPSLAGVLAQRTSLEAIPIYLVCVFIVLLGMYVAMSRPSGRHRQGTPFV